MNCHRLLQRIVVLETKLLAGLRKQGKTQQIVITDLLSIQPVSPVNLNLLQLQLYIKQLQLL